MWPIDRSIDPFPFHHCASCGGGAASPADDEAVAAAAAPAWAIALPDLRTRIAASPVAQIGPPDEPLVRALLERGFARRRLDVRDDLVEHLVRDCRIAAVGLERLPLLFQIFHHVRLQIGARRDVHHFEDGRQREMMVQRMFARQGAAAVRHRTVVESLNGVAALEPTVSDLLRQAGFVRDPRGMRLAVSPYGATWQ